MPTSFALTAEALRARGAAVRGVVRAMIHWLDFQARHTGSVRRLVCAAKDAARRIRSSCCDAAVDGGAR